MALEVETTSPDLIRDLEQSALPDQEPALEVALTAEEPENNHPMDIMNIIQSCLKDVM